MRDRRASGYIVSGDNHLLRLKQYGNAPVVKVADFMRRMQGQGSER